MQRFGVMLFTEHKEMLNIALKSTTKQFGATELANKSIVKVKLKKLKILVTFECDLEKTFLTITLHICFIAYIFINSKYSASTRIEEILEKLEILFYTRLESAVTKSTASFVRSVVRSFEVIY